MDRITKEQMIAEFGKPGVQNPAILDLISLDPETGAVVLTMVEHRNWGSGPDQFKEITEKINRYLGYALDGHLAQHYPQYQGKRIRICLDCAEAPRGDAVRFVKAAEGSVRSYGLDFVVTVSTASRTESS